MPVYGNASKEEPFQLSRNLPVEKRIELYEFEVENDENEVPAKKFKKRKPRVKKKEIKFFENIGKNVPPPKPKKPPKKCTEEVTKRVLPKRGALRQIAPLTNVQSSSALSVKIGERSKVSLMKSNEPSCPLSTSASSFGSLNISRISDKSTACSVTGSVSKQTSSNSLFREDKTVNSFNRAVSKSSSPCGNLLHQISFNDFNDSVVESIFPDKSLGKQSPTAHDFKIPSTVTVRNPRTRSKKTNVPRCSSPKPSSVRCSSPKNKQHVRCSSPNINKSPDRTLLFGATSPITRQNSLSGSLSSVGSENFSFNNPAGSVKSFNSSVKSFGNDTCLIIGSHDDTYKSVGEEDLCHYFGFEEEEEEEESCSNTVRTIPKKVNPSKVKVKVAELKPEKPPVDEVLMLLKSSVPADSISSEQEPEPFSLSSHIWSPLKSQPSEETKEIIEKAPSSKRGRPRTKAILEKPVMNVFDDEEVFKVPDKTSKEESSRRSERRQPKCKDGDDLMLSEKELTLRKKCCTKLKIAENEDELKFDVPTKEGGKTVNNVYKAPKRAKESNKQGKEKKECEGNKKEMDEFEALAASLNSQFQEIDNFNLAVE